MQGMPAKDSKEARYYQRWKIIVAEKPNPMAYSRDPSRSKVVCLAFDIR